MLEGVCEAGVDMTRMASVVRRHHVKHLNALEETPHDTVPRARAHARTHRYTLG